MGEASLLSLPASTSAHKCRATPTNASTGTVATSAQPTNRQTHQPSYPPTDTHTRGFHVTGLPSPFYPNLPAYQVRIGGGVYPEIREPDYLAGGQDYRVDAHGTPTMLNCLMYKMSYLE